MLECRLATPLWNREETGVHFILVRTEEGDLGILPDHLPLEAKLQDGSIVRIDKENGTSVSWKLGNGSFFMLSGNSASVFSRTMDRIEA